MVKHNNSKKQRGGFWPFSSNNTEADPNKKPFSFFSFFNSKPAPAPAPEPAPGPTPAPEPAPGPTPAPLQKQLTGGKKSKHTKKTKRAKKSKTQKRH